MCVGTKFKKYQVANQRAQRQSCNIPCFLFPRSTCSSSVVTLARPPSSFSLKITDRSFRYASSCLWDQLPLSLRKPHSGTSSSISYSAIPSPITFSSFDSPLWSSIIPLLFHSVSYTHLTLPTILRV